MRLLTMPKPNYCLITSFAMVLDCEVMDLVMDVGHDGFRNHGEEWVGFHTQELIDCALNRGYAVTKIQAVPVGDVNGLKFEPFPGEQAKSRLARHMSQADGIILGTGLTGMNHATAWSHDDMWIYDPTGNSFPSNQIRNFGLREVIAFLRFDKLAPK